MVLLGVFSKWDSFFQLIGVLLIFLFVLAITYVTTRWIGQYQQGMMQNKNIQVVETFRVSNNKFIQIIQVGKNVVNILTELTEEDLVWMPSQEERGVKVNENFQQIFTKLKDKIPRK